LGGESSKLWNEFEGWPPATGVYKGDGLKGFGGDDDLG